MSRQREVVAVHRRLQLTSSALHGLTTRAWKPDLALITRLKVLDGNLYVDWPCGLVIEVRPSDVNRHYPVRNLSRMIACTHGAIQSQGLPWRGGGKQIHHRESVFISLPTSLALQFGFRWLLLLMSRHIVVTTLAADSVPQPTAPLAALHPSACICSPILEHSHCGQRPQNRQSSPGLPK